jgi:hypothetical protein
MKNVDINLDRKECFNINFKNPDFYIQKNFPARLFFELQSVPTH